MPDKLFATQAAQYSFPYHYIPTVTETGLISNYRLLKWGIDYLTYMGFIKDLLINDVQPASLLDVGCGDGRLINMMDGKIPHLVGVDLVESAILFARAFNPGAAFYWGDVSEVSGKFQVVTLIEVMEHIPDADYPSFINKVATKLEAGGKLIVSVPTTNLPLHHKHHRQYDLTLLEKHLSSAFMIESYWFVTKLGRLYDMLNLMLHNRLFIVQLGPWRRMIWHLHKRFCYRADQTNGAHLVAIARLLNV